MPNRFPFNTPEHPEDNRSINKAFDRNYGNRLKSGDTTPLKYTIKDGDGEPLDKDRLMGMETTVKMKHEGVTAYEAEFEATLEEVTENYEGDLVARYKITEVLPPSDTPYIVEFHFEEADDRFIFPSGNNLELHITPSSLNSDGEAIKNASEQRLNEIVERKLDENPVLSEAEANELARQENYQELLDTGVMQTKINERLEGLEEEYAPKLTDLTAQLAQTESKLDFNPNAEHPLYIPCSTESEHTVWDQTTHPDVKYFPNGWNGYKYWMVHTPYPYTNDFYENPEVVASNDGVSWEVPEGLSNPIDSVTESQHENGEHFSDGALVHNTNSNTLEVWYRWRNKNTGLDRFYRMISADGVNWGNKELVYSSSTLSMSPTILFEEDTYKMWFVRGSSIVYMECDKDDVGNWQNEQTIPFEVADGERVPTTWHIHILKERSNLYHLLMAEKEGSIYYAHSTDGMSFVNAMEIIKPRGRRGDNNGGYWDSNYLYRGSMVKVGNKYRVYYGGNGHAPMRWRVGLSEGLTPYTLIGSDNVDSRGHRNIDRVKGNTANFRHLEGVNLRLQSDDYNESTEIWVTDRGRTGFRLHVGETAGTVEVRTDNNSGRGRISAQQVYVSEIKPHGNRVIHYGNLDLRNDGETEPYFKLLHQGKAGAGIKVTSRNTLDVVADNGDDLGLLKVGHVIFQDTDVSTQTGAVRYNERLSKLQLLSGGIWNNLNNYVPNTPTSSTSGGNRGDYATDENYLYVCHRPGNWLRFAKDSTW